MQKATILLDTLQAVWSNKEMKEVVQSHGYQDTARKCTVWEMIKFWISSAIGGWGSFRDSEEQIKTRADLVKVDYSTLSSYLARPRMQFMDSFTLPLLPIYWFIGFILNQTYLFI